MLHIRKATPQDQDGIWAIMQQVLATGDTYLFAPNSDREKILNYWFGAEKHTFVAILDDVVVGTYIFKENQPDLGSHVANGSYMVSPEHFGHGIGRSMGLHSLAEAKNAGFRAMQFNCVVKSNERAVRLWQSIGFNIIGEIPEAYQHSRLGLVNAYIMYQAL
jgi:ribosomal protein S18 acetylase RimI-like enzyme